MNVRPCEDRMFAPGLRRFSSGTPASSHTSTGCYQLFGPVQGGSDTDKKVQQETEDTLFHPWGCFREPWLFP